MFFQRFFHCGNTSNTILVENPLFKSYIAAGCLFTDGKHVLAGYQPNKRNPSITGIGGHKEANETYFQTAIRETIEEIYNVKQKDIPSFLISRLLTSIIPKKTSMTQQYVILHYDLHDLQRFLQICKSSGLQSPVYTKLPTTLLQLLGGRSINTSAEITHLCLLPVVNDFKGKQFVHPSFLRDMRDM